MFEVFNFEGFLAISPYCEAPLLAWGAALAAAKASIRVFSSAYLSLLFSRKEATNEVLRSLALIVSRMMRMRQA